MKAFFLAAVAALVVSAAGPARADIIGPDGCSGSGCFGGQFQLTYQVSDAAENIYQVNWIAYWTGTLAYDSIQAVSFDVDNKQLDSELADLTAAPGGTSLWVDPAYITTLNSGGCGEKGNQGFCTDVAVLSDRAFFNMAHDPLVWSFLVDFDNSYDVDANLMDVYKAFRATLYLNGKFVGNLSTTAPWQPVDGGDDGGDADAGDATPEPGMLLLLGTGLVVAGAKLRRRR